MAAPESDHPPSPASPASPPRLGRQPSRRPWAPVAAWLGGALAIVANLIGVAQFAVEHRPLVTIVLGAIAIGGAGYWLWRRPQRPAMVVAMAMMSVAAFLIGVSVNDQRQQPAATPGGQAGGRPTSTRFTGTIRILHPGSGFTLAPGEPVRGTVTGWAGGHQIWLSARATASTSELVQGPCEVDGESFTCADVRLPGGLGILHHIRVAVVTDAMAAGLSDATVLPVAYAAAYNETELYKG